jgi:exosortase/archaeosortase family protein
LLTYEWIMPLMSALVLFDRRKMLSYASGLPSWRGFGIAVVFLVAFAFSVNFKMPPLQFLSVTALTYAISYAFWGQGVAAALRFPLSLLAFAIPLSFYLKLIEALSPTLASGMTFLGSTLELTGFETFKGWFELKGFTLGAPSPYTGLQLLFSVAATTFSLAHFTLSSRLQRLALYLCTFPVAYLIDLLRSFFICLIACLVDYASAVSFYNYSADYLAFFVAVIFIFQIANMVVKISARYKKPSANEWLRNLEKEEQQDKNPEQSFLQSSLIVFLTSIATAITFILIG